MPNIVRETHDDLNVTLTLTISPEDYSQEFKSQLNKYRKTAHMKGFRKGKTPVSMIKKLYGKSLLVDIINKTVGEEVDKYIKEENLEILGQPLPAENQETYEFNVRDLETFEFKFDLGLAPEFEIKGLDGETFDKYSANIPDSMIDGDLEDARKKMGEQKAVEDVIQDEDIIRLQADEMEEDRIKEGGWANEFSVSFPELTDESKEIFRDKKTGDLVQFDIFNLAKDKDENFVRKYFLDVNEESDEKPEIGNTFQALIKEVTRLEPAVLDQVFFDKYFGPGQVEDEAGAREKMKENIQKFYDNQADAFMFRDIQKNLEEQNSLELPEAFLKRWMVASGNLPEGKTADEELENLVKGLSWSLIRGKLAKRFEVKVEEAEIKDRLRNQVLSYFGGYDMGNLINDYVEKMMGDEQQYHNAYTQVLSNKLFQAMKEVVTIKENPVDAEAFDKIIEEENKKMQPPQAEIETEEADQKEAEDGVEEAEVVE